MYIGLTFILACEFTMRSQSHTYSQAKELAFTLVFIENQTKSFCFNLKTQKQIIHFAVSRDFRTRTNYMVPILRFLTDLTTICV